MPYDRVIAGKVIRKLRREKGITQETLSGLSGIARSYLAMIETGALSEVDPFEGTIASVEKVK